jgi:hypothetical protein
LARGGARGEAKGLARGGARGEAKGLARGGARGEPRVWLGAGLEVKPRAAVLGHEEAQTVWQAYSYTTVSAFYAHMLEAFFPEVPKEQLCAAPETDNPALLEQLARLSAAQNALCPATSMELLKQMLEQLRVAGHSLLHMAFTFTMMGVNFIAAAVTIGHGDASVFLEAAMRYFGQLIEYVKEVLQVCD